MTLRRQLMAGITVILLAMFAASLGIQFNNSFNFVEEQLHSHARDANTSLGLAIQPYLTPGKLPLAETHINAMFDSGDYAAIVLTDTDGQVVFERRAEPRLDTVPHWFTQLINLPVPTVTNSITAGWTSFGDLAITSNPRLAYEDLWNRTVHTTAMLGSFFVIFLLASALLLKLILGSLRQIEAFAVAVSQREFSPMRDIPHTRELNRVSCAMNQMAEALRFVFDAQSQQVERLKDIAYADPLTGLQNQRRLKEALDNIYDDNESDRIQVHLLMVQLKDVDAINKEQGYEAGDAIVLKVAKLINETLGEDSRCTVFRSRGTSFPILAVGLSDDEIDQLCQRLCQCFSENTPSDQPTGLAHIGVYDSQSANTASELLSGANNALALAIRQGHNCWHRAHSHAVGSIGNFSEAHWHRLIEYQLNDPNISFDRQRIVDSRQQNTLYMELFARFFDKDSGQALPTGGLIAMAERLKLSAQIDTLLIQQAINHFDRAVEGEGGLALNVSAQSLNDPGFTQSIERHLIAHPEIAPRLVFEISEYSALQFPQGAEQFIRMVHQYRSQVAIEHFGNSVQSVAMFRQLRPDILKVSGNYSREIDTDPTKQSLLQTMVVLAHSLATRVIAVHVETEAEVKALQGLKVDGLQGRYFQTPEGLN